MDKGDRKFPCSLCKRSFEKRDRLRIHILHVHEKHRPHKVRVRAVTHLSLAVCFQAFSPNPWVHPEGLLGASYWDGRMGQGLWRKWQCCERADMDPMWWSMDQDMMPECWSWRMHGRQGQKTVSFYMWAMKGLIDRWPWAEPRTEEVSGLFGGGVDWGLREGLRHPSWERPWPVVLGNHTLFHNVFRLFFFFNVLLKHSLVYNVVLISAVQQSDSVIHIHTFVFILFSIMVYHRILNIVPLAIQ